MIRETATIQPGSKVTLRYTLRLADGEIVDTTGSGEPVRFVVGGGELDDGLEESLLGLTEGAHEVILLTPGSAFGGYPDPANVQPLERSLFEGEPPPSGSVMSFSTPAGHEIPGTIREITDAAVLVDFNHPLAGRPLTFEVEVVEIRPAE